MTLCRPRQPSATPLRSRRSDLRLLHKTERGAVCLNLATATDVEAAHEDFRARLGADMTAVLVQQMVPSGVEMIVGALHDPLFGP